MTDKIDEITSQYDRYWADDACTQQLRELWGNPSLEECNDCGVFVNAEEVKIETEKYFSGTVNLAKTPLGLWVHSTDHWYSTGGGGSAPSLTNREAFTTREEALEAGIDDLIEIFGGIKTCQNSCNAKTLPSKCDRIIEALVSAKTNQKQLELF